MTPKLYYINGSPPSRAVLLLIKAIDLEVEHNIVNVLNGEHMSPEFEKINPLNKIPALVDGDFKLADSHAINTYLVAKYAKDDSLYPKDIEKRAIIDQMLHFDTGILFNALGRAIAPVIRGNQKTLNKDSVDNLVKTYDQLEKLLEGKTYVAGNELSVADFSIVATISSSNIVAPIAENRYPNISNWLSRMQKLPYYKEANQEGVDAIASVIKSRLA